MTTGPELLILVPRITPRVAYIFDWLVFSSLDTPGRLTGDRDLFVAYTGPKAQYGGQPVQPDILFWAAVSLLFERSVKVQIVDLTSSKTLFQTGQQQTATFSGDAFADCFYLLSRYEEYLPFASDEFSRFPAGGSVLYKKSLLRFPLADHLKRSVLNQINDRFPDLKFRDTTFQATITIDIDQAFAYQSKSFVRSVGSMLKAFRSTPELFREELSVITGQKADPFNVYDQILKDQQPHLPIIFFILCSTARSRYDHPVNIHSRRFTDLVKNLDTNAIVGIHPSYYSYDDINKIQQEISNLKQIIKKPVTRSRQHYLRLKFPETYRHLLAAGIKEDYSLGFADEPGFRAGTCKPFKWYDLEKESASELLLFPITFLEISFIEHQQNNFERAWEKMVELMETVKDFSGHLIPVWHNHTIAGWGKYGGWTINYQRMIQWIEEHLDGK